MGVRRKTSFTALIGRANQCPASFAVTWQTSVDRLSASARRLLGRLAWLGPEPIPESLLEVPVSDLSEVEESLDPRDALVELATYSLVTRAAETPTLTVHRLVQDVTRRSLRNEAGHELLTEALRWVNAAFVGHPQDVRTWPVLDPLASHARAVVGFADAAGITDPTTRLMNQLGLLYLNRALHGEAEPLMRRALAIDETSFGPEHPNVATALNNLATLYQDQGRHCEAEPLHLRALAIREKVLGEDADVVRDLDIEELVGVHYEAPFTLIEPAAGEDYRYVVTAGFVTTTDQYSKACPAGMKHVSSERMPAYSASRVLAGLLMLRSVARHFLRLHLAGGWSLLFQFLVSFGKRIPDMPPYALFLITGLFPWVWASSSILEGSMAFISHSGLLRKAVRHRVPTLGVCLGAQLLAEPQRPALVGAPGVRQARLGGLDHVRA